jgi:hypothetical protein
VSSPGKGPSLGPLLSGSRPNFGKLVGFGGALPEHSLIEGDELLHLGSRRNPLGHYGASLLVGTVASRHVPSANALCKRFDGVWDVMPSGGVMASTPMPSHFIWEMGCQATWSRSSGAVALGARGSGPLMAVGGPEGSRIPSSPVRRRARSG